MRRCLIKSSVRYWIFGMPGFLCPNAKGYKIRAEAMEPRRVELMGERK